MKAILERDKTFYKKIFVIALPIIIQNFITSSLNIVDTIMIGKLGEVEIASVGIGNQYFFLFNILSFLFLSIISSCKVLYGFVISISEIQTYIIKYIDIFNINI